MLLLIDHRDSFTWNLAHLLETLAPVEVVQHSEIDRLGDFKASALVLSPGPGNPLEYPSTIEIYKSRRGTCPILGVCLGFQLMLAAEGARIERQKQVLHGVQTDIKIEPNTRTYAGLPATLTIGRYHSLGVDKNSMPHGFLTTGTDSTSGLPLSFEHTTLPLYGVQYHPESFLTSHGRQILHNILSPYL